MRWYWIPIVAFAMGCGSSNGSGGTTDVGTDNGNFFVPKDTSTACTPGDRKCDGNSVLECAPDGSAWNLKEACGAGSICANGACVTCQVDQVLCQGNTVVQCKEDGTVVVIETCAEDMLCTAGACVVCTPGERECRAGTTGDSEVWVCVSIGPEEAKWELQQTCTGDLDCINGLCLNPCASDIKLNTNQGCDYYAVDLENGTGNDDDADLSAANAQFAVLVTNPREGKPLHVEISETQKGEAIVSEVIPPKGHSIIKLDPRNIKGSVKGQLAWRVKGNHPFVAYQFNPLDNVNPVYSNDASLLLPVNALGKEYMVMTGSGGGAFITVVGTKSETDVTVTVSAPTQPGDGIPALAKGESFTTTLGAAEVLNLRVATSAVVQYTLTGSLVDANKNVAVFGGNACATTGDLCCCDHLEQQLFPTNSWGKKFVCSKAKQRLAEKDYWRILAKDDMTSLTLSGGINETKIINAGEYLEYPTAVDFMVVSDKPIMVGQLLASSYEIKPADELCISDNECASGVCNNVSGSTGTCVGACTGNQDVCSGNETCLDNLFLGDNSPAQGGSCLRASCGTSVGPCPFGSMCLDGDGTVNPAEGQCYETCAGPGAPCANSLTGCLGLVGSTYLCLATDCTANWECPGGWCSSSGNCAKNCNAQPCADGKSACLPAGFSADNTITVGICIEPDCMSDADCQSGHTCVTYENGSSCEAIGDPAFILAVPVEQFRAEYTFLAPNAYKEDYINVIAPVTAFVQLDGSDIAVSDFSHITGTEFMVARLSVADGVHTLNATEPVGLVVYGYHDDVSYGYPGGANLFDLGN